MPENLHLFVLCMFVLGFRLSRVITDVSAPESTSILSGVSFSSVNEIIADWQKFKLNIVTLSCVDPPDVVSVAGGHFRFPSR